MALRIPKAKDFWAGMMFMALAGLAIFFGWGLDSGTAAQMGPGYFPTMLSGCLMLVGLAVTVQGLRATSEEVGPTALRPFIVLVSVAAFGLLLPFGFVIALVGTIAIACLAGQEIRAFEVVALAMALVFFTWLVFVWALGLPFKLWPA